MKPMDKTGFFKNVKDTRNIVHAVKSKDRIGTITTQCGLTFPTLPTSTSKPSCPECLEFYRRTVVVPGLKEAIAEHLVRTAALRRTLLRFKGLKFSCEFFFSDPESRVICSHPDKSRISECEPWICPFEEE